MIRVFEYPALIFTPACRKLWVAKMMPEKYKTRESLLHRKKTLSSGWFLFSVLEVAILILIASLNSSNRLPYFLVFVPGLFLLFWLFDQYTSEVYGDKRASCLRYAFYVRRPEFRNADSQEALLALDRAGDFGLSKKVEWGLVAGVFIASALALVLVAWLLVFADVAIAIAWLVMGSLGLVSLLIVFCRYRREARRCIYVCEQVKADSPLRVIVSQARQLYPDPC